MIAHVGDGVDPGANGEVSMAAANDGLIGVVGVEMEAAPAENFSEDVARSGNTLPGGSPDADGERLDHIRSRRRTGLL